MVTLMHQCRTTRSAGADYDVHLHIGGLGTAARCAHLAPGSQTWQCIVGPRWPCLPGRLWHFACPENPTGLHSHHQRFRNSSLLVCRCLPRSAQLQCVLSMSCCHVCPAVSWTSCKALYVCLLYRLVMLVALHSLFLSTCTVHNLHLMVLLLSVYALPTCLCALKQGSRAGDADRGPRGSHTDIWGFATCVLHLATGQLPYKSLTHNQTLSALLKSRMPEVPSSLPAWLQQALKHCLSFDAAARPTVAHLRQVGAINIPS